MAIAQQPMSGREFLLEQCGQNLQSMLAEVEFLRAENATLRGEIADLRPARPEPNE